MTREEVHKRWCEYTSDGQADATVRDLAYKFDSFANGLRARYAVSHEALAQLTAVREQVVHEAKLHIINGGLACVQYETR